MSAEAFVNPFVVVAIHFIQNRNDILESLEIRDSADVRFDGVEQMGRRRDNG